MTSQGEGLKKVGFPLELKDAIGRTFRFRSERNENDMRGPEYFVRAFEVFGVVGGVVMGEEKSVTVTPAVRIHAGFLEEPDGGEWTLYCIRGSSEPQYAWTAEFKVDRDVYTLDSIDGEFTLL